MKFLKDNWLIIVVVFLFGGNLLQYINPVIEVREVVTTDTVTTIVFDSVLLERKEAEIAYLKEKGKGKIIYKTKVDTVLVNETEYIIPHFEAKIDTTFEKGNYMTAKYAYPQNEFTILHKYPHTNTEIKETKVVEEKKLFNFSHGIIAGAFVVPDGTIKVGIGYGLKLGINY